MLKKMIVDFLIWVTIAVVITVAFSVAIWEAFQYGVDDYTEDDCGVHDYFDGTEERSSLSTVMLTTVRMGTAYFGGGEDYVQCFARTSDNYAASILVFVYLLMAVVILMNMLIAMMAKTFDKVYENSLRNYKVRRRI